MLLSVTIFDVAALAGVSKTTVSAVLNNRAGVNENTRRIVREAAEQLHYVPNFNARNFVGRKSSLLGALIITDVFHISNYGSDVETGIFSQDVINGIITALENTNYGLISEYCSLDLMNDDTVPTMLKDNRVDGLMIIGSAKPNEKILKILSEKRFPVVSVGRDYPQFDSIRVDIVTSTSLAAKRLFDTGHRRVGLINCPSRISSSQERVEGFMKAADEAGIPRENCFVTYSDHNTANSAYNATAEMLDRYGKPDGIITANNAVTMGALRLLYDRDIKIPRDLSVVAHEDSVMYGNAAPPLTAINIQKEKTGASAVQMVLDRIEQGNPDGEPVSVVIIPVLTERMSVKAR